MNPPSLPHNAPLSSSLLQILSEEVTLSVLVLDSYIESVGKLDGPSYHNLLSGCIDKKAADPSDLSEWLRQLYSQGPKHERLYAEARRKAEEFIEKGMWLATWRKMRPPAAVCPRVLFGKGSREWHRPWIAVFNSRKSKLVRSHDEWLTSLRSWLQESKGHSFAIATSLGTLTYDLLLAHAQKSAIPFLLVSNAPLSDLENRPAFSLLANGPPPSTLLACRSRAVRCSKACGMVCRDRLLAFLADAQLALEIRENGNLYQVLQAQHNEQPRQLMVQIPRKTTRKNAGNRKLLEAFPSAQAVVSSIADIESDQAPHAQPQHAPSTAATGASTRVEWRDYLYHYTRSCPGPWPGQSYRQYLTALLENEPLCEHTALHTMVRILREGRIRASKKLVRGNQPVISWSAVPPGELDTLRKWSPGLIRWTFEPYGIAIRRALLTKSGARPVVYGNENVFARLKDSERFRYQRHEPPDCSWKHEREWRLAGDFPLDGVAPEDGFFFLPESAAGKLAAYTIERPLTKVILPLVNDSADG